MGVRSHPKGEPPEGFIWAEAGGAAMRRASSLGSERVREGVG